MPSRKSAAAMGNWKPSRTSSTFESTNQRYIRDHQEIPIHRLSAVSLLQSLRAGDRGLAIEMADDSSDNAFSLRKSSRKDFVLEVEEIVSTLSSSPLLHVMSDALQFWGTRRLREQHWSTFTWHMWIALQVRRTDIGRRPYLSAANHSIQLLWCCLVSWPEWCGILPTSDHEGVWATCTFSSSCKEDCDGRSLWPSDRECSSGWFISR